MKKERTIVDDIKDVMPIATFCELTGYSERTVVESWKQGVRKPNPEKIIYSLLDMYKLLHKG